MHFHPFFSRDHIIKISLPWQCEVFPAVWCHWSQSLLFFILEDLHTTPAAPKHHDLCRLYLHHLVHLCRYVSTFNKIKLTQAFKHKGIDWKVLKVTLSYLTHPRLPQSRLSDHISSSGFHSYPAVRVEKCLRPNTACPVEHSVWDCVWEKRCWAVWGGGI